MLRTNIVKVVRSQMSLGETEITCNGSFLADIMFATINIQIEPNKIFIDIKRTTQKMCNYKFSRKKVSNEN